MIKTVKKSHSPFFSIVVPSLNEEKYLPRLLEGLKKQSFKDFEVLHVDGKSCDLTREKAAEFAPFLDIHTHLVSRRNVSFQRNLGASKATGKWVVFMDADDQVKKNFFAQLHNKLIDNPDTDLFSCLMESADTSMVLKNLIELCNFVMMATSKVRPFAAGALIGIRRSKLDKLEFDCEAKMSEDHLFLEDAVKAGCKYKLFRQPKYIFSMRRFEKEGSFKVITTYIRSATILLAGPRFERFMPDYPMEGGAYYDKDQKLSGLLPSMGDIIPRIPKRQQEQVKKIIFGLQRLINDL